MVFTYPDESVGLLLLECHCDFVEVTVGMVFVSRIKGVQLSVHAHVLRQNCVGVKGY